VDDLWSGERVLPNNAGEKGHTNDSDTALLGYGVTLRCDSDYVASN
jgi:hypothetical protein